MNDTLSRLQKRFSVFFEKQRDCIAGIAEYFSGESLAATAPNFRYAGGSINMPEIDGGREILPAELSAILSEIFLPGTEEWNREDPAEVLFTELFLFHGGNFIVFPEIFADSLNGLRNLADTIFMTDNPFPRLLRKMFFSS